MSKLTKTVRALGTLTQAVDSHVSVYITFPVPENVDFKSSIPKFYEITKKVTKDLLYYGYAENGHNLMVRVKNIKKQHVIISCVFFLGRL